MNAIFVSSLVNKQLCGRSWKRGWSMVYCPWSLVSSQTYYPATSFPIKYTIQQPRFQSNITCTHLPSMVRARWLWRIIREPIRNGEILWTNNNWACYLLLYKPFYFFPSRACKKFISPYMPLQTNFSGFLNHLSKKLMVIPHVGPWHDVWIEVVLLLNPIEFGTAEAWHMNRTSVTKMFMT